MRQLGADARWPGEIHEIPPNAPPAGGACAACGASLDSPTGRVVVRAVIPQLIAAALLRTDRLSGRERLVFELLGLGYDNRSLARELQVSERTAKRHVTAILTKLGLESRLQAGLTAMLTLLLGRDGTGAASFRLWPEGGIDLSCGSADTDRAAPVSARVRPAVRGTSGRASGRAL
ncbi:MAG: LuxR C-terminal-related transcriptional regulator [Streptosporangiaceae bacterium]